MPKFPKFKVSVDEISYYLSEEIEAKDEEEAKEIYMQKLEEGNILVNKSEFTNFQVKKL